MFIALTFVGLQTCARAMAAARASDFGFAAAASCLFWKDDVFAWNGPHAWRIDAMTTVESAILTMRRSRASGAPHRVQRVSGKAVRTAAGSYTVELFTMS